MYSVLAAIGQNQCRVPMLKQVLVRLRLLSRLGLQERVATPQLTNQGLSGSFDEFGAIHRAVPLMHISMWR